MKWPLFLSGAAAPLGATISFIDRPIDQVDATVARIHGLEAGCEILRARPLPDCLDVLDPMEAPWTTEVLLDCGSWTGYLNNGIDGGDPTAIAPAVAREMGARCVVAQHLPPYGPGHAATQLWILGPAGKPPLMYERALSAHAEDGRWSWRESGTVQKFERPERYEARRVRDRLDRALLVEYLEALGLNVDHAAFFGSGTVVRQHARWPRRRMSVAQWRRENQR